MSKTTDNRHEAAERPVPAGPPRPRLRRLQAAFCESDYGTVLRALALKLATLGTEGAIGEEEAGTALAHICREWNSAEVARISKGRIE